MKKFLCMLFILICLPLSAFTGCFKPDNDEPPAETIEFDYQTYDLNIRGSLSWLDVSFMIENNTEDDENFYPTDFLAIWNFTNIPEDKREIEGIWLYVGHNYDEVDYVSISPQESEYVTISFQFNSHHSPRDIKIYYIETNEMIKSFSGVTLHS